MYRHLREPVAFIFRVTDTWVPICQTSWRYISADSNLHSRGRGNLKSHLTLILRRSRTGTVWFYTSTSNKRAARPKLYTESLTRDLKRMYSRLTLVTISINL